MIDTIYLETSEFRIKDIRQFTYIVKNYDESIGGPNTKLEHPEDENTEPLRGVYAKLSHYDKDNHRGQVDFIAKVKNGRRVLLIKIASLPKLLYTHNLFGFDEEGEFKKAQEKLMNLLDHYGIEVQNFDSMRVTRIDLAYTLVLPHFAKEYINLFKPIANSRFSTIIYARGITYLGKHVSVGIYDKGKQLRQICQKLKPEYFPFTVNSAESSAELNGALKFPKRCLRVEIQLTSPESVGSLIAGMTWGGLLSLGTTHLFAWFRYMFIELLEKNSIPNLNKEWGSGYLQEYTTNRKGGKANRKKTELESIFKEYKGSNNRSGDRWFAKLMRDFGFLYVKERWPSFTQTLHRILDSGKISERKAKSNSDQLSRVRANMKEALDTLKPMIEDKSQDKERSLRDDILNQLFADSVAIAGTKFHESSPLERGYLFEPAWLTEDEALFAFLRWKGILKSESVPSSAPELHAALTEFLKTQSIINRLKIPYEFENITRTDEQMKLKEPFTDEELKYEEGMNSKPD